MAETVVDFLLEDLKEILSCSTDFILAEKDQIEFFLEELEFIRAFLSDAKEKCIEHQELNNLVAQIREVSCKALNAIDYATVTALHQKNSSPNLRYFIKEIKSINNAMTDVYCNKLYGIGLPQVEASSSSNKTLSREMEEETVVGFDDEAMAIKHRLVGERKQLEVISIVGMGGIGKTTLATKVYNDPYIEQYFYIRGWTYVSQVYQKKDVLLRILRSVVQNEHDEVYSSKEERLGEQLYRRLKGKRYLIVIDDTWDTRDWKDLKKSFPDDNNGSRIMVTTRLNAVALHIKHGSPHNLRFLTQGESWDLLQHKAFRKGSCPLELIEIGKQIAAKCQGLPLAIVVVAGLLANKDTQDWWRQVTESVSSSIVGDAEQFTNILALSYKHLPRHLKSCFLYFGAFPEDYEIPVWRLICLWTAEGFVRQMEEKSLEDVAGEYLMDLIDRSLVLVSKKRSKGGIKACRMHDMLRDLCLNKAKEENFRQQIDWYGPVASPSIPISDNCLCFHSHGFHSFSGNPCAPHVLSFFQYVSSEGIPRPKHTISFIYKLLRVLDLWCIYLNNFPDEILQLFHLRYLELHVHSFDSLPLQISDLWN